MVCPGGAGPDVEIALAVLTGAPRGTGLAQRFPRNSTGAALELPRGLVLLGCTASEGERCAGSTEQRAGLLLLCFHLPLPVAILHLSPAPAELCQPRVPVHAWFHLISLSSAWDGSEAHH